MGLLSRILRRGGAYPKLKAETLAARRLITVRRSLEPLARAVGDRIEVVPDDRRAYVFLGRPPKQFGFAWIERGRVLSLREEATRRGRSPQKLAEYTAALRRAYQHNRSAPRFSTRLAGREIVVTPSQGLKAEVEAIVNDAVSA